MCKRSLESLEMPKIKPSSSVLPASYVDTNKKNKNAKSRLILGNEDDGLSSVESDSTLTADSEKETDSDSTVLNDYPRKRKRCHYIFKIKDEAPDSDEDSGSKQEISTSDTVIKKEPPDEYEDNKNGTDNNSLHPNSANAFSSNENVSNVSSYEQVCSSVDSSLAFNLRIKEEKDLCLTDTCGIPTCAPESHENVVKNEPQKHVLKGLFQKDNSVNEESPLKCDHLELPSSDTDGHSNAESIANKLSAKDATDKSRTESCASDSPPKDKTEKLNSHETDNDVLASRRHEQEICTEDMKSTRPMNSALQNQTPNSSPALSSTNNYNSVQNASQNSCSKNEMKNQKENGGGNVPTVDSSNNEEMENENDAYLYSSEAENTDISFSQFSFTNSHFRTQSLAALADYGEIDSLNSTLCMQTKTTVNISMSAKEKTSTFSEIKFSARNNLSSQNNEIGDKDARMTPPEEGSAISKIKPVLLLDLIEYSKFYLHFGKNDIEKCLVFLNKKDLSNSSFRQIFLGSKKVKGAKTGTENVFPTVSAETINMPCVEKSMLLISENSQRVNIMSVEENSNVNTDNLIIDNENKRSELPSTDKGDDDCDNSNGFVYTSETGNYTETAVISKKETYIKCDDFKVCDQNVYSEVQSSKKTNDGENFNIDSGFARVLSQITSYDAITTSKKKSNVECDNVKICDQNRLAEVPTSQNSGDDENSDRLNPMSEIIHENTSCKSSCHVHSSIENTFTTAPTMRNEMTPVIKIKEEKIDSMTGTESLLSKIENASVQSSSKCLSGESNTLIPSFQDLQKIIETSALLSNYLTPSVNKCNPLHSPPKNVIIKTEVPEIEEITIDGDSPVSSNINIAQPARNLSSETADDGIEMLIIKKKSVQRTQNHLSNRSGCNANTTKYRSGPNNNFNAVNASSKSNIFKTPANLYGMKRANISRCQQNIDNKAEKAICNNMFKDIVVKIENTGDYSSQMHPNDNSKDNKKEKDVASSSLKRTVYVRNQLSSSLNSSEGEKPTTQNEPPVKKMKNTPVVHKPMFSSSSSFTSVETNPCSCACKRKVCDETESNKKCKFNEKEHDETSLPNYDDEKNLGEALVSFGRMLDSSIPPPQYPRKHKLTYSVVSIPSKANKISSSLSDRNSNNESGAFSNLICSKASVRDSSFLQPPNSMNEISSCDVDIQAAKRIEDNHVEVQISHKSSSDQNSSNMTVSFTNAVHSKTPDEENKKKNLFKSRNEALPNSQQINCNPAKHHSNCLPLIFLDRRGCTPSSKCLHKNVGKNLMDINDFPSLILEWNANWLFVQRETKKCAPICEATQVKDLYRNELEYYNTYFPLHLLSVWLGISDAWKNSPPCFDSVFENQVKKTSFVKVSLAAVLDSTSYHNWPKREDIVLCNSTKSDGSEENLFGRVCNIMSKDYNPPIDSSLKDKACTLKKVKFELFCAELLDVPTLAIVKVQILSNLRIALLQNDALQNLNSFMKDIILDPKKYISRWKFIALCSNDKLALENSTRNIFETVASREVQITVVDTPTPDDGIFAITRLTTDLIKVRSPVLIGLKNKESFLKLANSLKRFDPILAIKKREVNLPDDLKKFTLEERSLMPHDIFEKCYVTLTLLSSVFLGDFSSAFSNKHLTCILHEAHLCTETETSLLLYYDVKHLVLFGNQEAQTNMHPLLKNYGYDISLFNRFCRVTSMYASF